MYINQLQATADVADLTSENYFALDGIGGSKKVPADMVKLQQVNPAVDTQAAIYDKINGHAGGVVVAIPSVGSSVEVEMYQLVHAKTEGGVFTARFETTSGGLIKVATCVLNDITASTLGAWTYDTQSTVDGLPGIMNGLPKSSDPHAGTLLQKVGNEIKELGGNALAKASDVDGIKEALTSYGASIYSSQQEILNARIVSSTLKIIVSSANKVRYIAVSKGDILKYHIYHWTGKFITCAFFSSLPSVGATADSIIKEYDNSAETYFADFIVTAPGDGYIAVAMSSNSEGNNDLRPGTANGKIAEIERVNDSQDVSLLPVRENVFACSQYSPINWICRLGWGVYNAGSPPEQSIPSYKMAHDKGCRHILFDVRLTSDGKFVCVHDDVVNRIIRNSDGSEVSSEVSVAASTLEQLNVYDWGLYKGQEWAGTKVLELNQILKFVKLMRISAVCEFKVSFTDEQLEDIAALIKMYCLEEHIMMNVGNVTNANKIVTLLPESNIGYGYGTIDSTKIEEIKNSNLKPGKRFACFSLPNYYNEIIAKKAAESGVALWFTEVDTLATLQSIDAAGLLDGCKYISSRVNVLEYIVSKYN